MRVVDVLREALSSDISEMTREITPIRLLYVTLLLLTSIVPAFYAFGPWGTKPATAFPIVGRQEAIAPDGTQILKMEVNESGFATIVYRGVLLAGQLTRSMADQDTSVYNLSSNNIKGLIFSLEAPTNCDPDSHAGVWSIRMRNTNAQKKEGNSEFEWLFLEKKDKDIESRKYKTFDDQGPYELFDWVCLNDDGTAKALCLDFIPDTVTNEGLKNSARDVAWGLDNRILALREIES